MSVYKRRICAECGKDFRDSTIAKKGNKEMPPPCPCGAATRYSKNWNVELKLPQKDGTMKPHRKGGFKTKEEAKLYEASLLDRRGKGDVFSRPKDTSMLNVFNTFLDWVDEREKEGRLASGSAESYRYRVRVHLKPFFTGKDARNIEWGDVDEYRDLRRTQVIEEGRGKGEAPTNATINREIATLKRALSIAIQKRILNYNPLAQYELLVEDNESDRYLTVDEIDKLLRECSRERESVLTADKFFPVYPKYLRTIVVLALNTGLRIDGVLTLRWEEVDWNRNEIVKMVKHHRAKETRPVRIPMNALLREELKLWQIRNGVFQMKGYVFPSPKKPGEHILITSNFGLDRALAAVGLDDVTFHTFRHTFCTHFLEAHPDKIEVLRKIVGHSSAYMTRRYAHITERATHAAMAEFSIGGK